MYIQIVSYLLIMFKFPDLNITIETTCSKRLEPIEILVPYSIKFARLNIKNLIFTVFILYGFMIVFSIMFVKLLRMISKLFNFLKNHLIIVIIPIIAIMVQMYYNTNDSFVIYITDKMFDFIYSVESIVSNIFIELMKLCIY